MQNTVANDNGITIRKMLDCDSDLKLYLKWMTDPETMKYWDGMTEVYTYERVVENYRRHMEEQVEQCMIEYNQNPVGYCQYCILNADNFEVPEEQYNSFVAENEIAYGIDMFLGEVEYRNQGIGTNCLKLLAKTLFNEYKADALMIDPKVHNTRAIQCYHKVGFRDLFVVPQRELQDGVYHDSLIMGMRKSRLCASDHYGVIAEIDFSK